MSNEAFITELLGIEAMAKTLIDRCQHARRSLEGTAKRTNTISEQTKLAIDKEIAKRRARRNKSTLQQR